MALVILRQAGIMLLLILVGAGCYRFGLLSKETVSQISSLVLKVVNPVVILLAYQREFDTALVKNLGWTFLLTGISFAVAFLTAWVCFREKEGRDTRIERFSAVYSNCGFMGIPLVQAMFGYEGVFYVTAFLTVFNFLVWSQGVMQMSGNRSLKSLVRVLYSPAILAIFAGLLLFFARITLPSLLTETLEMVGNLNTPLAMFVAGATIAQTRLSEVIRRPRIFWVAFVRLLLIPFLTILALMPFPVDETVKMTVVAAAAAPSAAIGTMMALTYHRDAGYASEIFGVTTLLSMVTMPFMMLVYGWL